MISAWHKTLLFAFSFLSVAGCREAVNLHIRAEPSEQRQSPPATKDRNGPVIHDSVPEKDGAKPAIKTADTLLPKTA